MHFWGSSLLGIPSRYAVGLIHSLPENNVLKGGLQALLNCIKDQDPDKSICWPCGISGYCCRIGVATGKYSCSANSI
ncbi:hypothetical protein Patl1_04578 [Pistacia atlantica]|uniref:Uncharacterized protein n=1 Tax=Pistacia atlantica TaxID=434234 RepID=A0ACC1BTK9_9ROSI|nr:hypothetical protein Patl1_04578 [Pistacia atlantica]